MSNNRPKKLVILIITSMIFFTLIGLASYSFFSVSTLNVTNVVNLDTSLEQNNMVFDSVGGNISLNVTVDRMAEGDAGSLAAENSATLTVNFQANTTYSMVCSYDIIYEWTSSNKYQTHTSGVTENEFTIEAALTPNEHVTEGVNYIYPEQDLAVAVGSQTSNIVVSKAQIESTGNATSTAVWNMTVRFYNVSANQNSLSGKNYVGRFKVANVACLTGTSTKTLADYLVTSAPKSGTSAVGGSAWTLNEDHVGEWRYSGKNPDNYVSFNGELWRIIGVMPNTTYCTGTFTDNSCTAAKTSSLVKIMRNSTEGKAAWNTGGANDWPSASLKTTLQGKTYASNAHTAVANWPLYGIAAGYTVSAEGSADVFYKKERNIDNRGLVYGTNSASWYGKVGLMYPSDYAYSTTGGTTYSRDDCIESPSYSWGGSDEYNTECAANSWVRYASITSTAPSTAYAHWFLTPGGERADYTMVVKATGQTNRSSVTAASTYYVHPVVYLTPETMISGGTGTYNNPYTIS